MYNTRSVIGINKIYVYTNERVHILRSDTGLKFQTVSHSPWSVTFRPSSCT